MDRNMVGNGKNSVSENDPAKLYKYKMLPDGSVEIRGAADPSRLGTELIIPAQIEGHPVTGIGFYAFSSCTHLTSVILPDSLVFIDDQAFDGCTSLSEIHIPENVRKIGYSTFRGCSSLRTAIVPKNVTEICHNVFTDCAPDLILGVEHDSDALLYAYTNRLRFSIFPADAPQELREDDLFEPEYLPDGTVGIAKYHGKARKLVIPDTLRGKEVSKVCRTAFADNDTLAMLTVPGTVSRIDDYAFAGCSALVSVRLKEGVSVLGLGAFYHCASLQNLSLPRSLTKIGMIAFLDCSSLAVVNVPEDVRVIESGAFDNCSKSLVLYVWPRSAAEYYAKEKNIAYLLTR